MGRNRKWVVRPASRADFIRGAAMTAKYGPKANLEDRMRQDFKKFCSLSRLPPTEALEPFLGQMLNDGMDPGSARNYVVLAMQDMKYCREKYVRKTVDNMQTHIGTRGHAPDVTQKILDAYMTRILQTRSFEEAMPVWILYVTGQRTVDVDRILIMTYGVQGWI